MIISCYYQRKGLNDVKVLINTFFFILSISIAKMSTEESNCRAEMEELKGRKIF
jgi:hypothetical protein